MNKYYEKHRKKRLAYQAKYYRTHPKKSKAYYRKRYKEIREVHIARTLDWYYRNREKRIKQMRIYNKKYFSKKT